MARRGFEPSRISPHCDFVFAENGVGFIRYENGRIHCMVNAFKFGERFSYKVFDTCWYYDPARGNKPRLPLNREEVVRFAAQAMIFTGLTGCPWTARSLKDGHKNFLEDSPLSKYLGEAFGYFHKNVELFNLPAKNNVKIFYSPDSCMCMLDAGIDNIFHTIDELVNNTIPFSLVTAEDLENLEAGQIVLLPKVFYGDETMVDAVQTAAARGVKFLSIGRFARYYEDGKERRHSHPVFALQESDGFYYADDDFIPRLRELNKAHEIVISESGILVEQKQAPDGCMVLHLLNAANEKTISRLTIRIHGIRIASADCVSLENAQIDRIDTDTIVLTNFQTTATLTISEV